MLDLKLDGKLLVRTAKTKLILVRKVVFVLLRSSSRKLLNYKLENDVIGARIAGHSVEIDEFFCHNDFYAKVNFAISSCKSCSFERQFQNIILENTNSEVSISKVRNVN